jgi:Flp pilus assembly pilin Flp
VARRMGEVCSDERGQAISEYAVLLVVLILVLIGTIRMVGQRADSAFSRVVNSFQQHPGGGGGGGAD